jgi:phosphatidate cytidylyltransferase
MNFHAAMHSRVVLIYLAIFAGILLTAGAVLSWLTWGKRKDVSSVWATYQSWLVLTPLAIGLLVWGRTPFVLFIVALSILGVKEFARATGLYKDWWMTGAVYISILALAVIILMTNPFHPLPGWFGMFLALPAFAIALILLIPVLLNRTRGQLQNMALAVLGFIYIGWMFLHLAFLTNAIGAYGYILYLLLAVELNDVAAFMCGKIFGRGRKHLFRSNISPRKTWEGAIGALAVSMALPWILRFSFPLFGPVQLVLTGLIVGIGGQLGDLSISVIKRDVGIKDMGTMLPGHGGILDRIDSLIYTAPLFLHMIEYYYGLYLQ